MVVSFTNHLPFRSRDPALDLVQSTRPDSAIWNTMHYTDDVLREFFATISLEPWFASTNIVITGDHGENLGEHDGTAGQRNGWRETVWVSLIIHGRDPAADRTPCRGRRSGCG
jgi:phosphoglycerol transferase MdoB-like AlkP superfamily enzyme